MTGETDHHGLIEPLSQEPKHHFDAVGIGFEIVQRRAFANGESFAAGLAAQFSDGSSLINPTEANEGVNVGVGNSAIPTTRTRTGVARGINRFFTATVAFN